MDIGMLAIVSNPAGPKAVSSNLSKGQSSSFASMLGSVLTQTTSELPTSNNEVKLETIEQLLSILELVDLNSIEEASTLISQANISETDEELLHIVLSHLQLSNDQFMTLLADISHLLQQFTSNGELSNADILNVENSFQDNKLATLLQLMSLIKDLPTDELLKVVNEDVVTALRAGKLFNLLQSHQDNYISKENNLQESLTADLKELSEKIVNILKKSKQLNRDAILQRTFANLVNDRATQSVTENTTGQQVQEAPRTETVTNPITQFQQVPKAEQLSLMLQNNGREVSPEQLMRQFNSILSKSQFLKEGGTQRLFIKLYPEHLGALRIELVQKNQMMVARILASTAMAREMLDSQLNSLKQAFTNQNIQVERIEVSQQLAQHERFFQRDQQQGEQQNSDHNEKNHDEQDVDDSFSSTFEDALLNVEV